MHLCFLDCLVTLPLANQSLYHACQNEMSRTLHNIVALAGTSGQRSSLLGIGFEVKNLAEAVGPGRLFSSTSC